MARTESQPVDTGLPAPSEGGRSITWRSLLLGTLGVGVVCGVAPFNKYVLTDSEITSGFLPLVAVMLAFLLVVGINGPLHWLARRARQGTGRAGEEPPSRPWLPAPLNSGELAVVLMMVLISASIPNWGLMRFLIPMPVSSFYLGTIDERFWRAFLELDLPAWLFAAPVLAEGRTHPVTEWFYMRVPEDEQIPWRHWVVPLAAWGTFVAAMMATLVAMVRLVVVQWALNERLPFPLVQVQMALVESPAPGRSLNSLFLSPMLWIGLLSIFAIHSVNALHEHLPVYFPLIPIRYDLTGVLTEEPLVYLRSAVKSTKVLFVVVGLTYFIPARAAFSLWGIYMIVNLVDVYHGTTQRQMLHSAWADQHLGAVVAFAVGVLWIGRRHWLMLIRNAVGLAPGGGNRADRITVWIGVGGILVMLGWLSIVGVQLWMAVMIVLAILVGHLVVARVVAETGMPVFRANITLAQIHTNLPQGWFTGRDIFFAGAFNLLGPLTTRDSLAVATMHGINLCQRAGVRPAEQRRIGWPIGWTLLAGSVLAAGVLLYTHYTWTVPTTREHSPIRNFFGAAQAPQRDLAIPFANFTQGHVPPTQHNAWMHMGIGAAIVAVLQVGALRWVSWPLMPVGFVASHGAFMASIWFSIFLGWLAKVVTVRLGGAALYLSAKPLFVGIIFGEALAQGTWILINAILVTQGIGGDFAP